MIRKCHCPPLPPQLFNCPKHFQKASASSAAPAAVVPDPAIVEQLLGMGFDVNGCKKAAFHTNNSGFEAAVNWIMSHMEDPDFSAPFVQPG